MITELTVSELKASDWHLKNDRNIRIIAEILEIDFNQLIERYMKKLFLILVVLTFSTAAFAQYTVSAAFTVANPQYDFERISDENIYGLNIDGGYNMNAFMIGGNLSYLFRGSQNFERALSGDQIGINTDITVTHSLLQLHLLGRLQYPTPFIIPYIDGLLGGSFFSTSTESKSQNSTGNQSDVIASSTNQSDFTYSIGYGAGLMANVYNTEYEGKDLSIWVDLKVRYLKGGDAEYLQSADDIYYNQTAKKWETKTTKSGTSMNVWYIGVAVKF